MAGPAQKISKVKFHKREIAPLHGFPSSVNRPVPKARRRNKRSARRRLGRFLVLLVTFVGIAFAGLYLVLLKGISSEGLTQQAESRLGGLLGPDLAASLTRTRVSLDSERNLAIEADGVAIRERAGGRRVGTVSSVKLGIKALSLARGKVDVARVELSGGLVDLTRPGRAAADPFAALRGENGLLEAPKFVEAVFAATGEAVKAADSSANQKLALRDFIVKFGPAEKPESLMVKSLEIFRTEGGATEASGRLAWRGQEFNIAGEIQSADKFRYELSGLPVVIASRVGAVEPDGTKSLPRFSSKIDVTLEGSRPGGAGLIRTALRVADIAVNTGRNRVVNGSGILNLELRADVGKMEILPSTLVSGSNKIEFTGAVAPGLAGAAEGYRFELVTSGASLQPQNSPESSMDFSGEIRGAFDPASATADIKRLGLRTLSGELYGIGSLTFIGTSPRAVFGLRIPKMSISHAKQLWPVNIAGGARSWVFEHVYGGMLTDSTVDFNIPESRYGGDVPGPLLSADEFQADFNVAGARFDVMGDMPPVRDAQGVVQVRGANTEILLAQGTAFLEDGETALVSDGRMLIPYERGKPTVADLAVSVSGGASAVAAIADREPVKAMQKAPFAVSDLSGSVVAKVKARFPLKKETARAETVWSTLIELKNVSVKKPFDGQTLTGANGTLTADMDGLQVKADAQLNGIPAVLKLEQPLRGDTGKRKLEVRLELSESARGKLTPGLNTYVKGPVYVELQSGAGAARQVSADLTKASINLEFAGWTKGPGIPAAATFSFETDGGRTSLRDFELSGSSFEMRGAAELDKSGLASADLSNVRLVRGDKFAAKITRTKNGYAVRLKGDALDARAILKRVTGSFESAAKSVGSTAISVTANIANVTGFNGENMNNVAMNYAGKGSRVDNLVITAISDGGGAVSLSNRQTGGQRQVQIQSADAGSILRFFDYYDKMRGGSIDAVLSSNGDGPLRGTIDTRNFALIDEPRMRSLVGGKSSDGGPSLQDAVKKDIDVSKVRFSRGSATIVKGDKSLSLTDGILRGDLIGLAFKGTAYDPDGNINMTGTFMPAYGLNRIFGEIPLLGQLLGNGEERGLIGITFRLSGKAKKPQLSVNPISLIAPGIFRQIFEFR